MDLYHFDAINLDCSVEISKRCRTRPDKNGMNNLFDIDLGGDIQLKFSRKEFHNI